MLEDKGTENPQHDDAAETLTPVTDADHVDSTSDDDHDQVFDESLTEELAALIDDGQTYAKAELAFQKSRAALAGKSVGLALGFGIVAIILLHIALLALAVGMVMALEPLVTIWGAIAIVVGVLLLGVGALVHSAISKGKLIGELFASSTDDESKTE